MNTCSSGRHVWLSAEDAQRCCAGYEVRWSPTRSEVPDGAEGVRMRFTEPFGCYYWQKVNEVNQ